MDNVVMRELQAMEQCSYYGGRCRYGGTSYYGCPPGATTTGGCIHCSISYEWVEGVVPNIVIGEDGNLYELGISS